MEIPSVHLQPTNLFSQHQRQKKCKAGNGAGLHRYRPWDLYTRLNSPEMIGRFSKRRTSCTRAQDFQGDSLPIMLLRRMSFLGYKCQDQRVVCGTPLQCITFGDYREVPGDEQSAFQETLGSEAVPRTITIQRPFLAQYGCLTTRACFEVDDDVK